MKINRKRMSNNAEKIDGECMNNKVEKINGKDMINIGIFTAVYFVLNLVIAAIMGFIPVVNMMIPLVSSIILGIPMMLYFTRIKKSGMVLITYIIYGSILTLAGVGVWTLIAGIICALAAELVIKRGGYKSSRLTIISYAICCIGANANLIQFAFLSEKQMADKVAYYGQEYMDKMAGYYSHSWMIPLMLLSAFLGGVIGGNLGRVILKKHFIRSGMV